MPTSANPRRTRIVATIGPASRGPAELRQLILAGVDVCRINCSHANAEGIRADVARIRRAAAELGKNVGILLDLQGPKIRTGPGAPILLRAGDRLTVVMDPELMAQGHRTGTTWPTMADDVRPGEAVLFADGALSGRVEQILRPEGRPAEVVIEMIDGGTLGSHKGINMPESQIQAPALTEKDIRDLAVGVEAGIDFVALSFVRSAQDIHHMREELSKLGREEIPVIAKIEKPQGVANIEAILEVVQGIMVARGDLGVEIPFEEVPIVQKKLIDQANRAGRLVITATQMLDSMERNPRPTRAEITDVANAILDGTDAVMLSGETATGDHPFAAVTTMDRIAREVENSAWFRRPSLDLLPGLDTAEGTVCRAAGFAARVVPRPMVVFTRSGNTARLASKTRPPAGVIAITHDQTVCDQLSMAWGVQALLIPLIERSDDLIAAGEEAILEAGLLEPGTEVVVLAGRSPMRGATNMMKIEILNGKAD